MEIFFSIQNVVTTLSQPLRDNKSPSHFRVEKRKRGKGKAKVSQSNFLINVSKLIKLSRNGIKSGSESSVIQTEWEKAKCWPEWKWRAELTFRFTHVEKINWKVNGGALNVVDNLHTLQFLNVFAHPPSGVAMFTRSFLKSRTQPFDFFLHPTAVY